MRRPGLAAAAVLAALSMGACGSAKPSPRTSRTAELDTQLHIPHAGNRALRLCGSRSGACHAVIVGQGDSTRIVYVETEPAIRIEPPQAVTRAGGDRLAKFEAGRSVLEESGCLACHKIGGAGNTGPGQDLAHVGSRLAPARIERAILHATAPMPSFSGLPAAELRALVEFLALLR